jgi:hypothetical protein
MCCNVYAVRLHGPVSTQLHELRQAMGDPAAAVNLLHKSTAASVPGTAEWQVRTRVRVHLVWVYCV